LFWIWQEEIGAKERKSDGGAGKKGGEADHHQGNEKKKIRARADLTKGEKKKKADVINIHRRGRRNGGRVKKMAL